MKVSCRVRDVLGPKLRDLHGRLAAMWHLKSRLDRQEAINEQLRAAMDDAVRTIREEAESAQSILVALDREAQCDRRVVQGTVYTLAEELETLRARVLELEAERSRERGAL